MTTATEAEEARKAAEVKADADAGEKLDKVLECLDSLSARMDAYEEEEARRSEEERKDEGEEMPGGGEEPGDEVKEEDEEAAAAGEGAAAPVAADEDGEGHEGSPEEATEEEEIAERGDVFADAMEEMAGALTTAHQRQSQLEAEIRTLKSKMPKQISDADYHKMADAQARADSVYAGFGQRAPRPLDGESLIAYRRRLAKGLKQHSPTWSKVDLVAIADSTAFDNIEAQIYTDAQVAARNPIDLQPGELREIIRTNQATGQRMIDFVGKGTFIGGMGRPSRRAKLNARPNAWQDR